MILKTDYYLSDSPPLGYNPYRRPQTLGLFISRICRRSIVATSSIPSVLWSFDSMIWDVQLNYIRRLAFLTYPDNFNLLNDISLGCLHFNTVSAKLCQHIVYVHITLENTYSYLSHRSLFPIRPDCFFKSTWDLRPPSQHFHQE